MNFDLNIENYTKQELVDMFGLPPNFDKNILDIKGESNDKIIWFKHRSI
jgi:hypothetical protein